MSLQIPGLPQFKFYFDIRGVETFEFDQAPDGWLNTLLEFAASKGYTALRRSLSTPYKFIGNAAFLCRREWFTYFAMADVVCRIEMLQDDFTYLNIYTGRLNFAAEETENNQTGFICPMISADFTNNIDAYDGVEYAISLEDGINLELTPIQLYETATLLPQAPPDGQIYYNYFIPLQVINNTQNSIDRSVQDIPFAQALFPPNFIEHPEFFRSRLVQNTLITGTITGFWIAQFQPGITLSLGIYDGSGTEIYPLFSVVSDRDGPQQFTVTLNRSISTPPGDRLYLYMKATSGANDVGITITDGQIDLSYKTITPPTMCKALTGEQVFAKLLQKMNPNRDSLPNLPVPYQSFLLTSGVLKDVVFTSSDSMRAAKGSFFKPGDTIGQGVYQAIGDVTYNGRLYADGTQFSFDGTLTFSGPGYVQKLQSIYVGQVLNAGDSLSPGASYLVSGNSGSYLTYDGVTYDVGDTFTYVLGEDTFTVSEPSVFAKQLKEDAQLIISLATFFKSIRAKMGGNACMGVFRNRVFIEDLTMCYQLGNGGIDLGNVSLEWKQNPASDMLFANFKGGYVDQQYDALNGAQEVNSSVEYSSALMLSPTQSAPGVFVNELDLQDPLRSDPFGIESVRITQNDTAASRSNNDTFCICINPIPISTSPYKYYHPALAGDALSLITGVPDGYYNFFLSPKSNFLRGAPYLASIFWNMGDYPITVANIAKNGRMVYVDLAGNRVTENEPILVSQLGDGLFIPIYFKGQLNIGHKVLNQLDQNPYTDIQFTISGIPLRGFINNFRINPATGEKQDIVLLVSAAKSNDMTQFIKY